MKNGTQDYNCCGKEACLSFSLATGLILRVYNVAKSPTSNTVLVLREIANEEIPECATPSNPLNLQLHHIYQ